MGAPLSEHLPIIDEVLELEITPNRPDAMGVYGVARDVHAVTAAPLSEDPTDRDAEPSGDDSAEDHASVEIADPDICLRFTARVFEDVKIGPSPPWLKQRLMAAGQRPISNVVDITNYVMLTTAQPLHAFDLDEVRGRRIIVRRAQDGEKMTTLDGVERTFSSDMALVCDAEGPSGIAGVMGGQISEMSDSTTRVLMEAATWVGPNIMRTSKALGLRTEASARFEKQLHPEQAIAAQRLAARLMVELCGARMVPGTIDAYPRPAEPRVVALRAERMERLLGERIEDETASAILERLGFRHTDDGWLVPPWRDSDVQREADLIEEVARIHGLDKLPTTLPAREQAIGRLTGSQPLRRRLEDLLRDRGLLEAISYSFTSPARARAAAPHRCGDAQGREPAERGPERDAPADPAGTARRGTAQRRPRASRRCAVRIRARVPPDGDTRPAWGKGSDPFTRADSHLRARHRGRPGRLAHPARPADFYAVKALLEALMEAAGVEWRAQEGGPPFLHPGRAATIVAADGSELGWLGELHPLVLREWELDGPMAGFELDADRLFELAPEASTYSDVTSFPAVLQDIAVIVPDDVSAERLAEVVREGAGDLLSALRVFDLYHGEQVGEGSKSLALRLEFRAPDRTLTDEEVAERRAAIEQALESIGGRLRA